MATLGAVVLPSIPPERLLTLAKSAEQAGLEELWLWEDCFLNGGIATASAVLASTDRLRLGVGLLPVPLRNVALAAMETSSLLRMFPGRATVAIGHGVQSWMAQVNARAISPLTLLREYADAFRALLAGETVSVDGRYVRLEDVALAWPPERVAPALLVGAAGPKTLALAGEVADGILLDSGLSAGQARDAIALARSSYEAAGRTGPLLVTTYLMAATGSDARERLAAEIARRGLAVPSDVSVVGEAEEMINGIARWVAAGGDAVVLQPTPDDPDPEGFLRFIAEELQPRMR